MNIHHKKMLKFFLWFFIILIFIFHQWIIAVVTTPIRCAILGEKSLTIYVSLDEWKTLRSITESKTLTAKEDWDNWKTYNDLEESNKEYRKFIYFDRVEYEVILINEKSKLVLYRKYDINNIIKNTVYTIYYDTEVEKVLARSIDVYGSYPNYIPFTDSNLKVTCKDESFYSTLADEMLKYNL